MDAEYSLEEIGEILNFGSLSKDAVKILMENARRTKEIEAPTQNVEVLQMFKAMINQNQQFMTAVINRLDLLESKEPKQLALPDVANINPRAYLNQLVREYAQLKAVEFRKAWNVLYDQFLYRCHENIKVKAKNEGVRPIDYMDRENKLLTACSIMKGLIDE